MGWLGDYADAKSIDVDMTPLPICMAPMEQFADRLAAEVEQACVAALARGPGWRVWRSDVETRQDPVTLQWAMHYRIEALEPGASPPGSGMVYGPWPDGFNAMIVEDVVRSVMALPLPDCETPEFDSAMEGFSHGRDGEAVRRRRAAPRDAAASLSSDEAIIARYDRLHPRDRTKDEWDRMIAASKRMSNRHDHGVAPNG